MADGGVHEEALGVVQVTDSGAAVAVVHGHVRSFGCPLSAILGYQPVSACAVTNAVVVSLAVVVLCFHSSC